MDPLDRKILNLLQEDATLPVAAIAERVGLTATPCWRRIQKLEEAGLIRKDPALADRTVERLSDVLRYTLRRSESGFATLGDELGHRRVLRPRMIEDRVERTGVVPPRKEVLHVEAARELAHHPDR